MPSKGYRLNRKCSVDGCEKLHKGLGFCANHLARFKAHGDPLLGRTEHGKPQKFIDSLFSKESDECILWPYNSTHGYGTIRINGKMVRVSRIVCEAINGPPINDSLFALHLCGNGHLGCVNPKHLSWGTPKENSLQMVEHGNSTRGTKNARAILTEETVLWIKRELSKGRKPKEIGEEIKVKRSTIKNIENGSNWAWLNE